MTLPSLDWRANKDAVLGIHDLLTLRQCPPTDSTIFALDLMRRQRSRQWGGQRMKDLDVFCTKTDTDRPNCSNSLGFVHPIFSIP
jgi:hypothetical protein